MTNLSNNFQPSNEHAAAGGKRRGLFIQKIKMTLIGCLAAGAVSAAPVPAGTEQEPKVDYSLERPEVKAFIEDLTKQNNLSKSQAEEMLQILAKAKKSDRVLELISRPAEKRLEWKDYRKIFMTPERIEQGVEFWKANEETLLKAEQEYGVPAQIIVAIIGVETYYGRLTGGFKVLDALSTLSFDYPPRSEFFTRELGKFLILTHEQKMEPYELTGSYAGAMGIPQFMPSSYQAYAVDFTGDGKRNIWQQEADAIGSVGNYLQKNGWRAGKPIASKARVQGAKYEKELSSSVKPAKTLKQLEKSGWKPVNVLPSGTKAAAIKFEGENGPEYWLGMENFRVITTYNRSRLYALAVYQLSREVKSGYKASGKKDKSRIAEKADNLNN